MPFCKLIFSVIIALALTSLLSGCFSKPVRHLASDACLIKPGASTRADVLTYLGEPDDQRILSDGSEEWVYVEDMHSEFQKAPVVGRFFDGKGRDSVYVVLQNDVVQTCSFKRLGENELDWTSDYSWQKKIEE